LNLFEVWAKQKKIADEQIKLQLQRVVPSRVAQQWFAINQHQITDNGILWAQFRKDFLEKCPTENDDDDISFAEIISKTQGKSEKASLFLQKIHYLFGNKWNTYPEKEIVKRMVRQLNLNTRRYVECRGVPDNYVDLMAQIQHYEVRGGAKDIDEMKIKTEVPANYIGNEDLEGISETLKTMSILMNQQAQPNK